MVRPPYPTLRTAIVAMAPALIAAAGSAVFASAVVATTHGCTYVYRTNDTSIGFGRPSQCNPIFGANRPADSVSDWTTLFMGALIGSLAVFLVARALVRRLRRQKVARAYSGPLVSRPTRSVVGAPEAPSNRPELVDALAAVGVDPGAYDLDGEVGVDEKYVLRAVEGGWATFYAEHGRRRAERRFDTEAEACASFFEWVLADPTTRRDYAGSA